MIDAVTLRIGEYYASNESEVIHTVLGSCVAVCLFDPYSQTGGMNHILLPGKADMRVFDNSARYGINAMELLINNLMELGAKRIRLKAKVFGGAHVISTISEKNGMGPKNVEFVEEFLKCESIEILASDVGGVESRKIFFFTDTGEVLLKRIPPVLQRKVLEQEKAAKSVISRNSDKAGEITLFE